MFTRSPSPLPIHRQTDILDNWTHLVHENNRHSIADNFSLGKDFIFGLSHVREEIIKIIKVNAIALHLGSEHQLIVDDISFRINLDNFLIDSGDPTHYLDIDRSFLAFVENQRDKKTTTSSPIAAACKLSIPFCKQNGGKIHFLLSGISIKDVAQKNNYSEMGYDNRMGQAPQKPNVTGSELRAMYRMWRDDPDSINHVIFYNDAFARVDAPWISDPSDWAKYGKSLEEKKTNPRAKLRQRFPDHLIIRN